MKYFIPDWDDRVDPNYDFKKDVHSKEHDEDPRHDVYAHEIFGEVPYDGILVSRMTLEISKKKYAHVRKMGIRAYLRLPACYPIMGDCGAWGYVKEREPPFKTKEMLEYYAKCGFDLGVSIDHLVVPPYEEDRYFRYEITRKNAREMYDLWDKHYREKMRIIGVAQGWDVESYRNAIRELLEIGYEYVALGGVAKMPTAHLIELLKEVSPIIKDKSKKENKKINFHVFGIARKDILKTFYECGVTSFDSASFLRQAWLSAKENYHTKERNYTAIRVRSESDKEGLLLRMLEDYSRGNISLKKVLLWMKENVSKSEKLIKEYERTLTSKPWEKCECEICKNIGVNVIIFKGNNRNRRRGFHNTWVWYRMFREKVPKCAFLFSYDIKEGFKDKEHFNIFKRVIDSPFDVGYVEEGKMVILGEGEVEPRRYSEFFVIGDLVLEGVKLRKISHESEVEDFLKEIKERIRAC